MNKNDFTIAFKQPLSKEKVVEIANLIFTCNADNKLLFELCFSEDQALAFRASWVFENVFYKNPVIIIEILEEIIDRFPKLTNKSAQRHFTGILCDLTSIKASAQAIEKLNKIDLQPIIQMLFTWLIDENIAVAVKANCVELLGNFSTRYPSIKEELIECIDYLIDKESIAFFARAKKVRKMLNAI